MTERTDSFPDLLVTSPKGAGRPQALFAACTDKQKGIEASPFQGHINYIMRDLLFLPLFEPAALPGFEPSGKRYPFNFSITEPLDLRVSEAHWRYQALLQELRKQPDRELRWLLIARWLEQESICEPEQLLPGKVLRNLLKRFREHLRRERFPTSPTDLRYAAAVRLWLPYFEPLLAKRDKAPERHRGAKTLRLMELGYEVEAIKCCLKVKTPVAAVSEWLHHYRGWDARRVRNAYSRVWGRPRRKR